MEFGGKMREIMKNTYSRIAAGAIALATTGGILGHQSESERDKLIPLTFSELTQLKEQAEARGGKIDPFVEHPASVNDFAMKIFESWNYSWQSTKSAKKAYETFAIDLERRLFDHAYEHNLTDFIKRIPELSKEITGRLAPFGELSKKLGGANTHLRKAWKYDSHDNTHIKMRTRTSTTVVNGKTVTRTETYPETVYDSTDHSYSYNRKEGEAASILLDQILEEFEDLSLRPTIRPARKIQEQNLGAILESRKDSEELGEEEIERIADSWVYGSTIYRNKGILRNPLSRLKASAEKWRKLKQTAKSQEYRTHSRFDDGPKEYRAVKKALSDSQQIRKSLSDLTNPINLSARRVPVLSGKIEDFIGYTLGDERWGEDDIGPKKRAKEIMDMTKELYSANFEGGLDVRGYRPSIVALYALAGLAAGGLLSAGAHFGGKRIKYARSLGGSKGRNSLKDTSKRDQRARIRGYY